jgi:hypothetical protein
MIKYHLSTYRPSDRITSDGAARPSSANILDRTIQPLDSLSEHLSRRKRRLIDERNSVWVR